MDHPIYLLRKTLGLTQARFGREVGVSESRICQIERGHGRLKDEHLMALVEKYRVEMARLGLSVGDFLRQQDRDSAA